LTLPSPATLLKKAALFLVEIVAFTLLAQAAASVLFSLPIDGIAAQLAIWFTFGLVLLGLGWIFNKSFRSQGIRELGFRFHKNLGTDAWLGVCGFALLNLLSLPFDLAALQDRAKSAHELLGMVHLSTPFQILVGGTAFAAALGFFTGAFHEEIRFRGYYQGAGSNEVSPLAGVLIALVPFSLGHYYAQPDWTLIQVLATIVPGIVYGVLYNATGSLVVVMTTHTLVNVLSFVGFLLSELMGTRAAATFTLAVLALLSLLVVVLRWNRELQEWRCATRRLFAGRPFLEISIGIAMGLALLAIWPLHFSPVYSLLAGTGLFGITLAAKRILAKGSVTDTAHV